MDSYLKKLESIGLAVPEILLPARDTDLEKWAVIACDQFTQDSGYWENLKREIGDAPSTLNMILPEAYLNGKDIDERIKAIHQTMKRYLQRQPGADSVFALPRNAGVLVERTTHHNRMRHGLVAALDLEQYDWKPDACLPVRASESVIEERLPARMQIRRNAPVELPHVILLYNDEDDLLFPFLEKLLRNAPYIYNCPLNAGGGSIRGKLICRKTDWNFIGDYFAHITRSSHTEADAFVFAVGDGNHSLAAAKAVWEEYKQAYGDNPEIMKHPARWALVEIENIYDPGLVFEPIHRLLFNVSPELLLNTLSGLPGYSLREMETPEALAALVAEKNVPYNRYGLVFGGSKPQPPLLVETADSRISTVPLDPLLDTALNEARKGAHPADVQIDYVHETGALLNALARAEMSAGIILPPFNRKSLFPTLAAHGPLPRKSFSMGEAREKRYYLESRRLFDE
ncbi:MAG: DUF1015 domain-containing protein [Spirochaetaceae bacterium]|jgi:hypothetical protein|nr:DUF1015 domain-containing protein [Spirochaetaceae bacterium]